MILQLGKLYLPLQVCLFQAAVFRLLKGGEQLGDLSRPVELDQLPVSPTKVLAKISSPADAVLQDAIWLLLKAKVLPTLSFH